MREVAFHVFGNKLQIWRNPSSLDRRKVSPCHESAWIHVCNSLGPDTCSCAEVKDPSGVTIDGAEIMTIKGLKIQFVAYFLLVLCCFIVGSPILARFKCMIGSSILLLELKGETLHRHCAVSKAFRIGFILLV